MSKPKVPVTGGTPPLAAEAGERIFTIPEAAAQLGIHERTVRAAIKSGELEAFLPRGKTDPRRAGPGLGWRIRSRDLHTWFFGA